MILNRYINRQLLVTTLVVTFVLVMVLVTGRFIKYLADAAVGEIAADALFLIMAYRLPEFLQLILPLSLYIGILLVLGGMYVTNEVTVMNACGIGRKAIIRAMSVPVTVTVMIIAAFALYITPLGDEEGAKLRDAQRDRSILELLTPGRFHTRSSDSGSRATYAGSVDKEKGVLENVFLSDFRINPETKRSELVTVWAAEGRMVQHEGMNYLELLDGKQYQGQPGAGNFRNVTFERGLVRVGEEKVDRTPKVRSWPTAKLINSENPEANAELQWRISLILIVPIMSLAAIPLARVNPRQGRFGKIIPAVLLYMLYMGVLLVLRSWLADIPIAKRPWYYHMAWVHLLALMMVFVLYNWSDWRRARSARKARVAV